jgi:hypothetical protein
MRLILRIETRYLFQIELRHSRRGHASAVQDRPSYVRKRVSGVGRSWLAPRSFHSTFSPLSRTDTQIRDAALHAASNPDRRVKVAALAGDPG